MIVTWGKKWVKNGKKGVKSGKKGGKMRQKKDNLTNIAFDYNIIIMTNLFVNSLLTQLKNNCNARFGRVLKLY